VRLKPRDVVGDRALHDLRFHVRPSHILRVELARFQLTAPISGAGVSNCFFHAARHASIMVLRIPCSILGRIGVGDVMTLRDRKSSFPIQARAPIANEVEAAVSAQLGGEEAV
jgi:hypothetical protein